MRLDGWMSFQRTKQSKGLGSEPSKTIMISRRKVLAPRHLSTMHSAPNNTLPSQKINEASCLHSIVPLRAVRLAYRRHVSGKITRQLKIKLFNSTFQVVGNSRLVCLTLWKIITLGLHFKMSTEVKVADWDKSDFLTTPPIFFSLWRSPAFVPTKISILVLKTFQR